MSLGHLLMFAVFAVFVVYVKIVAILIVVFFVGLNVAHGKSKWPEDYYRKSKRPVTWKQKINPFWWPFNQDDPITLPKNDKFWPGDPLWLRKIKWFIRNPFNNMDRYVLGFWDKQDWWARERWRRFPEDWDGKDTMWPLDGERVAICMPFWSHYIGPFEFYVGWKPNGEFAMPCFRRRK